MQHGYETTGLVLLVALVVIPLLLTITALLDWVRFRITGGPRRKYLVKLAVITNIIVLFCVIDAFFLEPNKLTITRISDISSRVAPQTGKIKIVHISDTHFEHNNILTHKLISELAEVKPDIIVLTGDIHQCGPYDARELNRFLGRLNAIAPVYSSLGYDNQRVLLHSPIGKNVLISGDFREVNIRGTKVTIQGFSAFNRTSGPSDIDNTLCLMLDHLPDNIPFAAKLHPDWYFCGHTHGGQVRLPIWGAIITNSSLGKRYEYGRYKLKGMNIFVTRGIGLEPRPAPQARFLCPPEMVVLTISRKKT